MRQSGERARRYARTGRIILAYLNRYPGSPAWVVARDTRIPLIRVRTALAHNCRVGRITSEKHLHHDARGMITAMTLYRPLDRALDLSRADAELSRARYRAALAVQSIGLVS